MYTLVKEKSQRKGFQYIIMGYALNKYVIYLDIYIYIYILYASYSPKKS
jgi:hypothetical protein